MQLPFAFMHCQLRWQLNNRHDNLFIETYSLPYLKANIEMWQIFRLTYANTWIDYRRDTVLKEGLRQNNAFY